jgi:hypothetical protein
MKPQQIVRELEAAARQLGLQVRVEKGGFRGGWCKVGEVAFIMLNKRHPPEVHVAVLAEGLRDQAVETIFLKPVVRKALEEAWIRGEAGEWKIEEDKG